MRGAYARPQKPSTRFFHVSTQIYHLPAPGLDPQVDELVARGEFRDIVESVMQTEITHISLKGLPVGGYEIPMRIARSKGVTYRRRGPKPQRVGHARRQAKHQATMRAAP